MVAEVWKNIVLSYLNIVHEHWNTNTITNSHLVPCYLIIINISISQYCLSLMSELNICFSCKFYTVSLFLYSIQELIDTVSQMLKSSVHLSLRRPLFTSFLFSCLPWSRTALKLLARLGFTVNLLKNVLQLTVWISKVSPHFITVLLSGWKVI